MSEFYDREEDNEYEEYVYPALGEDQKHAMGTTTAALLLSLVVAIAPNARSQSASEPILPTLTCSGKHVDTHPPQGEYVTQYVKELITKGITTGDPLAAEASVIATNPKFVIPDLATATYVIADGADYLTVPVSCD